MRNRWGLIAAVAIVSFFTGGWLLQQGVKNDGNVYQQARLFDDVLSYIDRYYVDSLGESELYNRATNRIRSCSPATTTRRSPRPRRGTTAAWASRSTSGTDGSRWWLRFRIRPPNGPGS
jgi:hypothetical protein